VNGLEITLTSNAATIAGTVTDNGAPATGYGVVVFAEDNTKWTFPCLVSRRGQRQSDRRISRDRPSGRRLSRGRACPRARWLTRRIPKCSPLVVLATSVLVGRGETQTVTLKLTRR
jgi:hypothetical protein